eukprot:s107_g5.t1
MPSSAQTERYRKAKCLGAGQSRGRLSAMSGRNTRMAQWLDYRVRVTISDARMLVGTFMAFDKYMNVVLADCEEFRKIKSKGRKDDEKEVKRTLGFVVLRGETIVSLMAEAPPPSGPKKPDIQPGPGRGQVAGAWEAQQPSRCSQKPVLHCLLLAAHRRACLLDSQRALLECRAWCLLVCPACPLGCLLECREWAVACLREWAEAPKLLTIRCAEEAHWQWDCLAKGHYLEVHVLLKARLLSWARGFSVLSAL